MSEAAANLSQPTIEQIGKLAQEKAAGCRRQGSERICRYCGEVCYWNRIVLHIIGEHRGQLIAELQGKRATK